MAVSSLEDHPLARALAGGPGAAKALQQPTTAPLPDEQDLDSLPDQDTSFHVVDADADQRLCLEAAARGHSLVLTGAPGTGKRQTIVNLIAHFLGEGKKVLCVGPKETAVQAISERFRQLGLADCCASPGKISATRSPSSAPAVDLARLKECRDRLAGYVQSLHAVREPLQRTAWSVLCELAELDGVPAVPLGLPLRRKDAEGSDSQVVEEIAPTWLEE